VDLEPTCRVRGTKALQVWYHYFASLFNPQPFSTGRAACSEQRMNEFVFSKKKKEKKKEKKEEKDTFSCYNHFPSLIFLFFSPSGSPTSVSLCSALL
jgi:hypothetical protein